MAIKKVVLHLGMSKAGSRSIQETLFNNTQILQKYGYRYLTEWGRNHLSKLHHIFSPDPVTPLNSRWGKYISKKKHKKDNKKIIAKMLKVINTSDCETLFISGECFGVFQEILSIQYLKDFINKYFKSNNIEVNIILIVRNPLLWIISFLQQNLCNGGYFRDVDFFKPILNNMKGL